MVGDMRRRVLLGIAGWLAALVAAIGVGLAAIGVLEDGITGSGVRTLDRDSVRRELSSPAAPAGDVRPSPETGVSPPSAGTGAPRRDEITRVLSTEGGTVTAACAGGLARLVAWSPRQGFEAEKEVRGPAAEAAVTFESDDAEYDVTVTCGPGGPSAGTVKDDGHGRHGRDHD